MTPLIISTSDDLKPAIVKATRHHLTPDWPNFIRSHRVFVPSLTWYRREWMKCWNKYRVINKAKTYCEGVAYAAVALALQISQKKAIAMKQDFTIGMFLAGININESPFLGCGTGSHCTLFIVFTEDGKSFTQAIYEPQSDKFEFEPLDKLADRIDFMDVIL